MKLNILAFADIRTTLELPDVSPDVVLLLGDIPSRSIGRIDKKYACTKLGVLGNHCHPKLFDETNIINMHNRIKIIDGVTYAGFEGSPVYKQSDYGQHTEFECTQLMNKIGDGHIDIFLSHSNPAFGDMELDEAHRGFKAYNPYLMRNQISHFFHGHLHDPFVREIGQSTVHSVYPYTWINIEVPAKERKEVKL